MRHYSEADGDENEGMYYLWRANVKRALRGKKGQKALRDLREALLQLPEKKLIEGALCTINRGQVAYEGSDWLSPEERHKDDRQAVEQKGEGVCINGAYIWYQLKKQGLSNDDAFTAIPTLQDSVYQLEDTAFESQKYGLTFTLAWELAYMNDDPSEFGRRTPEQRYEAFMAWLNENIQTLPAQATR